MDFLRRMKGKKIMYVGDSLSLNHWQSLVCLLHAAVPNSDIKQQTSGPIKSWIFEVNISIAQIILLHDRHHVMLCYIKSTNNKYNIFLYAKEP